MALKLRLVKNFYKSKSLPLSAQRIINMYPEIQNQDDTKTDLALFRCSGLKELVNLTANSTIFALKSMGNFLYAVSGTKFYQIDNNFNFIEKGSLPISAGKVRLSPNNNGYQMVVLLSNGDSYIYNSTADTFTKITDPDYQSASDVTSIDGYTIFSVLASDQFFYSEIREATKYSSDDYQTAEAQADILVAVRNVAGELWALGEKTIEIYRNTGGNPTFSRIDGAIIQTGCFTRDSVSVVDGDTIIWLGNDKIFYKSVGYRKQKISTYPIDQELERYSTDDIINCSSFSYTLEGHRFYSIVFPDKKTCFTYDLNNGLWHERDSFDSVNTEKIRWRANCFESFGNRRIFGDYKNGVLYYADNQYYKEGDNKMNIEFTTSPLWNNFSRTIIDAIYLDVETGVGTLEGEGNDPKIMFQISNDGGRTFSSELTRTLGKRGKYKTIVSIKPVGISDNYTFKFRVSDPVKFNFLGGYITYKQGAE